MESHANRGILIGVAVLITVSITSALFIVLGYVLDIYKNVARIDYTLLMKSNELEKYSVSRYVGGNTLDGDTITGVQLYNLLNKIISQHNMKYEDQKVELSKCLSTWNNANNIVLHTNDNNITIKCLSNDINFVTEEGKSFIEKDFKAQYYCSIVKQNEVDETLYFKRK